MRRTRQSQRLRHIQDDTPRVPDENQTLLEGTRLGSTRNMTVGVVGQDANARRIEDPTPRESNLRGNGKRTTSTRNNNQDIPTNAAVQPAPAKKQRNTGPARGRPMPLELTVESEIDGQPYSDEVAGVSDLKGKRALQRTSSFYPGYGGRASMLEPVPQAGPMASPEDEDTRGDTDEWTDEEDMNELAQAQPGQRGKMAEAIANERPTWQRSASTGGPPASVSRTSSTETMSSHDGSNAGALVPNSGVSAESSVPSTPSESTTPSESALTWPANTELRFAPGVTRVMLTWQRPLIRLVIHDSIDHLRACLTFENAFPDGAQTLAFVRRSLITAAETRGPTAAFVHKRLLQDEDYISKIVAVPRARVPIIRGDVKERSNSVILPVVMAMGSPAEVVRFVEQQLSSYNYTFPRARRSLNGNILVMRSRPYRNDRIIFLIRALYFTGGSCSFATRFDHLFPTAFGEDIHGTLEHEVPIPMVALVATALYASMHEWRTGTRQTVEFSASAYIDVYQGHVNTLRLIQESRINAFHSMMADIYSRASGNAELAVSGAPVADLDLDQLE